MGETWIRHLVGREEETFTLTPDDPGKTFSPSLVGSTGNSYLSRGGRYRFCLLDDPSNSALRKNVGSFDFLYDHFTGQTSGLRLVLLNLTPWVKSTRGYVDGSVFDGATPGHPLLVGGVTDCLEVRDYQDLLVKVGWGSPHRKSCFAKPVSKRSRSVHLRENDFLVKDRSGKLQSYTLNHKAFDKTSMGGPGVRGRRRHLYGHPGCAYFGVSTREGTQESRRRPLVYLF